MNRVDKSRICAAFDRAASHYDALAQFQHRVCEHLLGMLPAALAPARILDAGCGTGYGAQLLQQHWPAAQITGCDLSPEMVRRTRERGFDAVCGDLEHLPFPAQSFEVIWSSLALQWCDPGQVYRQLHHALRPGGMLAFATLASGSLHELDWAFSGIDEHRRVLGFTTPDLIQAALAAAGFGNIRITPVRWVTQHPDFRSLLETIRGIGAGESGANRRRTMMGKHAWQQAQQRYETLRTPDGTLPATYETLFVLADS